jgi:diazepam-binding inhibitor (GABA receptor modulator, acyl-CoA-binding protein)
MELKERFEQAVAASKQLSDRPDNNTLLKLYSLYKQATDGDAPASSDAGMFDIVAKAKYSAWDALRGKSPEAAMEEYVALYEGLIR